MSGTKSTTCPVAAGTAAEDARFHAWLTRGGVRVSAVKGDPAWNRAVARSAADQITGTTR
jgi:hypothetical protein